MSAPSGRPKQIVVLMTTGDSTAYSNSIYHAIEDNDEQPLIHYRLDGEVPAGLKVEKPTATKPNMWERVSRTRLATTKVPVRDVDSNPDISAVYISIASVYKPGDEIWVIIVAGIFGSEMTFGPDVLFTQKGPFEKLPLAQHTLVIGPDDTGLRVQSYQIIRVAEGSIQKRQMCNLPSLWRSFEQSPTMCYWIMLQTRKIIQYKPQWIRKANIFDREPEWEEVMSPHQALGNELADTSSLSQTARRYRLRGYRVKHSEHEDLNIEWVVWSAEHD